MSSPGTSSAGTPHGSTINYDDLLTCVHCGLCLPVCPTYLQLGNENDSPRGRIYLMRAVAEGRLQWDDTVVGHLDLCLECRACETACPAGVEYGHLLESARAEIEQVHPRSTRHRWLNGMLRDRILPFPDRLRLALAPVRLLQRLGVADGLARALPGDLGTLLSVLPPVPSSSGTPLPEVVPAVGTRRYRVALLTGCVGSVLFERANIATVEVLTRNGCEVVIPRDQGCCGALHHHTGAPDTARELGRRNLAAFDPDSVDAIITNSAGCGSTLKEYGRLFAEDEQWAQKARKFGEKVKDIAEFLAAIGPEAPSQPLQRKVTYHDACHLAHGQGVREQPRQLLEMIPGVECVPLRDSDRCCGSAGMYNIMQPEMAGQLLQNKIEAILETGADTVATGNPGCAMHIARGLRERGLPIDIKHPVELLAESYGENNGAKD